MKTRIKTMTAAVLIAVFAFGALCACSKGGDDDKKPADYGSYGADFARKLSEEYPCRKPYSIQEEGAGGMIKEEFEKLGYDVEVQSFNNSEGKTSRNYVVRIEGKGFLDEEGEEIRRTVVIGAHYDDTFGALDAGSGYDGISDNSSGIGCIMTIAKEIASYKDDICFDVEIVAFGAGNSNYAGAYHYYNDLTPEERDSIEVMYCIDSIYAGDKIYANAGYNSLDQSHKYTMRRKLYQAYDVAYDKMLSSINGYNLLYNESNIVADVNGDGIKDIYREVSHRKSDYLVFDNAGIQVVYFDSCDYFFDTIEEMKETKNLQLQQYGGAIRGTSLDSMEILDPIFKTEEEDRLEVRINNTAYVILESLMKGSDVGMTEQEYKDYLYKLEHPETEVSAEETT